MILLVAGAFILAWGLVSVVVLIFGALLHWAQRSGRIHLIYEDLEEPRSHVEVKEPRLADWERDGWA